jgi:hypothetical protein
LTIFVPSTWKSVRVAPSAQSAHLLVTSAGRAGACTRASAWPMRTFGSVLMKGP